MTYKLFPDAKTGIRSTVAENKVVELLNENRRGIKETKFCPTLLTPEEAANGLIINDKPVTAKALIRFARRKEWPIPHYRFSTHMIRFPKGAVAWWDASFDKPLRERGLFIA